MIVLLWIEFILLFIMNICLYNMLHCAVVYNLNPFDANEWRDYKILRKANRLKNRIERKNKKK